MLAEIPKTRSQLISALSRASFRSFSIADINSRDDVLQVSKTLTRYAMERKTACVVILLDG